MTIRLGVDGSSSTFERSRFTCTSKRLGVTHVVGAPHAVDERVTGEDAAGVVEEQLQQLELLQRQGHGLTPDHDLVTVGVEPHVAHLEHAVVVAR